nr:transposase [Burkholderia mayonis]
MFKPRQNVEPVEVLTQPEQRCRRSVEEKLAIARETFEPGATVSGVARRHQVNANQVFAWRKLYQDGSLSAVSAGEQVVPASDLAEAMKQIREFQRLLGKKWYGNSPRSSRVWPSKKWIAHSPSLPEDD